MPADDVSSQSRYWVPILGHAIRTLELFEDAETRLSLQEISTRAGISRSSAFRILFTLTELGYIRKHTASRRYYLGARVVEVAKRLRAPQNIAHIVRPYMRDLQNQFAETVNLAALQGSDVYYVDIVESARSFRMAAQIGSTAPLHASAVGKTIAAFLPEDTVKRVLMGRRFRRLTPTTITTRTAFTRALAKIRQQGYAIDNEEVERGAYCIAVPILDREGHSSHAVSVSGPAHRMRARTRPIVRELLRASAMMSRDLQ